MPDVVTSTHASKPNSRKSRSASLGHKAKLTGKLIRDSVTSSQTSEAACDPYVICSLAQKVVPEGENRNIKTKASSVFTGAGRNVAFNDGDISLMFNLPANIENYEFRVSVWDKDLIQDDLIGNARIDLSGMEKWGEPFNVYLSELTGSMVTYRGTMVVRVTPDRAREKLHFDVLRLTGMRNVDASMEAGGCGYQLMRFVVLASYLCAGAGIFITMEDWTYGEAIWFMIIQTTTVGYGDVFPTKDVSRYVDIFFLLTGTVVVGTTINVFFIAMVAANEQMRNCRHNLCSLKYQNHHDLFTEDGGVDYGLRFRAFALFAAFIILVVAGQLFLFYSESTRNPDFGNFAVSLEYVFVTLTTVGFGNVGVNSTEGYVFMAIFILLGITLLGEVVSAIVDWQHSRKMERLREMVLSQALQDSDEWHFWDDDNEGSVSRSKFTVKMLTMIGAIEPDLIDRINERFDELDTDKSGRIERSDFGHWDQSGGPAGGTREKAPLLLQASEDTGYEEDGTAGGGKVTV